MADKAARLNDIKAFEHSLAPQARVEDQANYMPPEEESSFIRKVAEVVERNPEGLAQNIANACGKGMDEAKTKALEHSKNPFCEKDAIITWGKDGSVLIERQDGSTSEERDQGTTHSSDNNSINEDAKEALQKIFVKTENSFDLYRIVVRYSSLTETGYLQCLNTPFGELMETFPASLEFYHGRNQIHAVDTLTELANEDLIDLDDQNRFVLDVMEPIDEEPIHEQGHVNDHYPEESENSDVDEEQDAYVPDSEDGSVVQSGEESEDYIDPPIHTKLPPPPTDVSLTLADMKKKAAKVGAKKKAVKKKTAKRTGKRKVPAFVSAGARKAPASVGTKKTAKTHATATAAWAQGHGGDEAWVDVASSDEETSKETSRGKDTRSKETSRGKDTRTGRGNRKRRVWSYPQACSNQMDSAIRQNLDASVAGIERAQYMATPRCFHDKYDADSDTDSVAGQRRWPRVIMGHFIYTEQQPNPNGGGDPKAWATPQLHFNTGTKANSVYFHKKLKKAVMGKQNVSFRTHESYEKMKQAVYGHGSIVQPQDNKAKTRRMSNASL
jgi:hypothetical protein